MLELVIVAACMVGLGTVMQKIGLDRVGRLMDAWKSPFWDGGTLILASGFLFYLTALQTEPLAIVQPLMNVSIFVIVFIEFVFLKKMPSGYSFHYSLNMKPLAIAAVAGCFFGAGSIMAKIAATGSTLMGTLLNPLYILSLVLAGIGFVIFQWSLKDYKYASHTTAISGTLAIVVPIVAGILFLNETLTVPQLVGVAVITTVAAFLMLKRG